MHRVAVLLNMGGFKEGSADTMDYQPSDSSQPKESMDVQFSPFLHAEDMRQPYQKFVASDAQKNLRRVLEEKYGERGIIVYQYLSVSGDPRARNDEDYINSGQMQADSERLAAQMEHGLSYGEEEFVKIAIKHLELDINLGYWSPGMMKLKMPIVNALKEYKERLEDYNAKYRNRIKSFYTIMTKDRYKKNRKDLMVAEYEYSFKIVGSLRKLLSLANDLYRERLNYLDAEHGSFVGALKSIDRSNEIPDEVIQKPSVYADKQLRDASARLPALQTAFDFIDDGYDEDSNVPFHLRVREFAQKLDMQMKILGEAPHGSEATLWLPEGITTQDLTTAEYRYLLADQMLTQAAEKQLKGAIPLEQYLADYEDSFRDKYHPKDDMDTDTESVFRRVGRKFAFCRKSDDVDPDGTSCFSVPSELSPYLVFPKDSPLGFSGVKSEYFNDNYPANGDKDELVKWSAKRFLNTMLRAQNLKDIRAGFRNYSPDPFYTALMDSDLDIFELARNTVEADPEFDAYQAIRKQMLPLIGGTLEMNRAALKNDLVGIASKETIKTLDDVYIKYGVLLRRDLDVPYGNLTSDFAIGDVRKPIMRLLDERRILRQYVYQQVADSIVPPIDANDQDSMDISGKIPLSQFLSKERTEELEASVFNLVGLKRWPQRAEGKQMAARLAYILGAVGIWYGIPYLAQSAGLDVSYWASWVTLGVTLYADQGQLFKKVGIVNELGEKINADIQTMMRLKEKFVTKVNETMQSMGTDRDNVDKAISEIENLEPRIENYYGSLKKNYQSALRVTYSWIAMLETSEEAPPAIGSGQTLSTSDRAQTEIYRALADRLFYNEGIKSLDDARQVIETFKREYDLASLDLAHVQNIVYYSRAGAAQFNPAGTFEASPGPEPVDRIGPGSGNATLENTTELQEISMQLQERNENIISESIREHNEIRLMIENIQTNLTATRRPEEEIENAIVMQANTRLNDLIKYLDLVKSDLRAHATDQLIFLKDNFMVLSEDDKASMIEEARNTQRTVQDGDTFLNSAVRENSQDRIAGIAVTRSGNSTSPPIMVDGRAEASYTTNTKASQYVLAATLYYSAEFNENLANRANSTEADVSRENYVSERVLKEVDAISASTDIYNGVKEATLDAINFYGESARFVNNRESVETDLPEFTSRSSLTRFLKWEQVKNQPGALADIYKVIRENPEPHEYLSNAYALTKSYSDVKSSFAIYGIVTEFGLGTVSLISSIFSSQRRPQRPDESTTDAGYVQVMEAAHNSYYKLEQASKTGPMNLAAGGSHIARISAAMQDIGQSPLRALLSVYYDREDEILTDNDSEGLRKFFYYLISGAPLIYALDVGNFLSKIVSGISYAIEYLFPNVSAYIDTGLDYIQWVVPPILLAVGGATILGGIYMALKSVHTRGLSPTLRTAIKPVASLLYAIAQSHIVETTTLWWITGSGNAAFNAAVLSMAGRAFVPLISMGANDLASRVYKGTLMNQRSTVDSVRRELQENAASYTVTTVDFAPNEASEEGQLKTLLAEFKQPEFKLGSLQDASRNVTNVPDLVNAAGLYQTILSDIEERIFQYLQAGHYKNAAIEIIGVNLQQRDYIETTNFNNLVLLLSQTKIEVNADLKSRLFYLGLYFWAKSILFGAAFSGVDLALKLNARQRQTNESGTSNLARAVNRHESDVAPRTAINQEVVDDKTSKADRVFDKHRGYF